MHNPQPAAQWLSKVYRGHETCNGQRKEAEDCSSVDKPFPDAEAAQVAFVLGNFGVPRSKE